MKDMKLKSEIKDFIVENFLYGEDNELRDDVSFLEKGLIDSTGVLELVAFIEKRYEISVKDEELIPDNLDSVDKIVAFINKKMEFLT